tara:strand:+ start:219 stop:455 length:237 start_codon:yes stop_codon:yes gene_type:complete
MAKRGRTPELDLHGVRHCDVPQTLHRFLTQHWSKSTLHIITGKSESMRNIIREELRIYDDIRYYISMSNAGVIVIEMV